MKKKIPVVPGRGLIDHAAIEARLNFLASIGNSIPSVEKHSLNTAEIQKNIESFVGSIEIPLGLVGPLCYNTTTGQELVYTLAGTLEGALVASMNRGARAVSLSGGFSAEVLYQRMLRAPLILLKSDEDAVKFEAWVKENFAQIKAQAESHSNHAELIAIEPVLFGKNCHLKFIYSTGDASGQNMTTTCTWHALLWIVKNFTQDTGIAIERYIIEGNAASDKKISAYTIREGRGIRVLAHCFLKEEVIQHVLRTTSDEFLAYFEPSREIARRDGMVGYTINVANAIAALFVASGQDLASVHESGHGEFLIERASGGLTVSLDLTNLVIGTVGGGTYLQKQKEVLELMGCAGSGKVERFASLIAGFALGLELSTYAAIVNGAFAKAHEKLGRNRPVHWLTRSEIDLEFVRKCLRSNPYYTSIIGIETAREEAVENGIITQVTNKVSNKLIGFFPLTVVMSEEQNHRKKLLLKLKALDIEVIKGLHVLAAIIDPELADLLSKYKEKLEYWECHNKEILLYEALAKGGFSCTPAYLGKFIDEKREIYTIALEYLEPENLIHINSQENPELWSKTQITKVIEAISEIHLYFLPAENRRELTSISEYQAWEAEPLYRKFVSIMQKEANQDWKHVLIGKLKYFPEELKAAYPTLKIEKTVVHNDFNSRNIAILKPSGSENYDRACIYDWELAVLNIPHRDIVEFLSFVMVENFSAEEFFGYLSIHIKCWEGRSRCSEDEWQQGYIYALKEYLLTRVSFYEVAGIHARYTFSERILRNGFRMLELLEEKPH
jgi:hydroxymethylglutaryl-CoA reductase (NADPH)